MGLFDRVERKLDRAINGAFARAFKAEVQPVEIVAAMRRAMDDRAAVVGRGRALVPNLFTIELAPGDHDRLTQYGDALADELIAAVEEHAESQRYQPGGRFQVDFVERDDLDTGVFRVRPATARSGTRSGSPVAGPPRPRHRPVIDDDAPRRRNRTHPPEAVRPAEGAVGMAGNAASAAAGAAAGTAAAGRAGGYSASEEPTDEPRDGPPGDVDEQRRSDLAAWGEDSADEEWAGTHAAPATRVNAVPPPELRPDPSQRPWIELEGDTYPLLSAITVLGRDTGADITLDDPGISRRHCEIRVTYDGPHVVVGLRDLGSTNGTFVDGERINSHRVQDGDRVTIGRRSFLVRTRRR